VAELVAVRRNAANAAHKRLVVEKSSPAGAR